MLELLEPRYFTIRELTGKTGLKKHVIRFYIQEVLPDYIATRFSEIEVEHGKATLYPVEVLERIKFIIKVKEELKTASGDRLKPTIKELRGWMNNISDQQVRDVLSGDDTINFAVTSVKEGVREIETIKGERLPGDSLKYGAQVSAISSVVSKDSAADYLAEVMPSAHMRRAQLKPETRRKQLKCGPDLEIHYPGNLSPSKEKQLKLVGELLQTIVSAED